MNRRALASLLQANTDRWRGPTLCSVRSSSTWTEHGDKCFAAVAIDCAIRLHCADVYGRCIALISLVAFWPLRPLRPLRTGGSLRTGDTLNTLGALWTGGALGSGIALWSGLSSADR